MRRSLLDAAAAVGVALLAGCSAGAGGPHRPASGATPPLGAPYLEMTGVSSGYAVWPSGGQWLVLRTSDRFAHVTNSTPPAVPTDGGLAAAFTPNRSLVAVAASERLTVSPVLVAPAGTTRWDPLQLPGRVLDSRGAVGLRGDAVTAITPAGRGTLYAHSGGGWTALASGTTLAPGTTFELDAVSWYDRAHGVVTGKGPVDGVLAFVTADAGRSWAPVTATAGAGVAAGQACLDSHVWLVGVLTADGTLTVLRSRDQGRSWAAGTQRVLGAAEPVLGCHGSVVWASAAVSGHPHLQSSEDAGRSWRDRGAAPDGLTDLTPTGQGDGFAASSGDPATLWAVADSGSSFRAITMPAWVARLGQQMGDS